MALAEASGAVSSGEFTLEQKAYLHGFFTAVARNHPYVGKLSSGLLTNDATAGGPNLATEPEFFGTPVSDLCAEEVWKYEANPLDVWDQLLTHAAEDKAPDAEHRFRFKFHGLFYVAPAQDSFMLRLRVPGGILRGHQLRGLAALADEHGSGRLDITTRAGMQIREFAPRNIVRVLNTVRALGMTSQGSGADNIRNITASPLSGLDNAELIDVQPYADALQAYILHSRDLFGLPRKFNIAFDNGGVISTLAGTNDIGFVAVRMGEGKSVPPGVYFRVLLCGITGHRQFASDSGLLLRPEQLVAVAAAMVRVFAENGDRTDRKKARLKYLIDSRGVDRFLEETERKLAFPILRVPAEECEARHPIDRSAHLGVHAQQQPGLSYIGVCVPVGWLNTEQARTLADLAERYGSGEIRLTVWQNLLLPNIATQHVDAVCAAIRAAGLDYVADRVLSGTVACTGNRGCRFAATDTKTHALELARSLDAAFRILQPINLHVTGCPHSCAQHYIGDIGLMGVKIGGEPGYQVNLGGGTDNQQALARELFPALRYEDLKPALHQLLRAYIRRCAEEESFLDFCGRHTIEELRGYCDTPVESETCS
jgi:ferredoxin-nitrite reductase